MLSSVLSKTDAQDRSYSHVQNCTSLTAPSSSSIAYLRDRMPRPLSDRSSSTPIACKRRKRVISNIVALRGCQACRMGKQVSLRQDLPCTYLLSEPESVIGRLLYRENALLNIYAFKAHMAYPDTDWPIV